VSIHYTISCYLQITTPARWGSVPPPHKWFVLDPARHACSFHEKSTSSTVEIDSAANLIFRPCLVPCKNKIVVDREWDIILGFWPTVVSHYVLLFPCELWLDDLDKPTMEQDLVLFLWRRPQLGYCSCPKDMSCTTLEVASKYLIFCTFGPSI
jgi:hypothetical protein